MKLLDMAIVLLMMLLAWSASAHEAAWKCRPGSKFCVCDNEETGNRCYIDPVEWKKQKKAETKTKRESGKFLR
jgi:hypothetical protein